MVKHESYLLDTNVIIEVLRGNSDIISKIESVGQENCYISEITIAELLYGAVRGNNQKNFHDVVRIEKEFEVLPIRPSFQMYAETRNKKQASPAWNSYRSHGFICCSCCNVP